MNARALVTLGLASSLALAAIAAAPVHERAAAASPAEAVARGAALLTSHECARCHTGRGIAALAPLPVGQSCRGCHVWIHEASADPVENAAQRARYPLWDRYDSRVKDFVSVPDLAASGARLDPAWVARYVRAPHKVRPGLREEMIRTTLTEDEAAAVAATLAASRPSLRGVAADAAKIAPSRDTADVAEGARLYIESHCEACHAFGAHAASPGIASAPDLALARERMRPADIAAFVADPSAFGAVTAMPSFDFTATQAARLRDFLLASPLVARAVTEPASYLPLLTRAVPWTEVRERVFGAICIHCHMNADANAGDGGPGNTGGLGYAGANLDFETWEGVVLGAKIGDGPRVSILEPGANGEEPPLIARLRARSLENAKERAGAAFVAPGGAPGMPLGLQALSPEDFQLVRSWVAQGAPGPNGGRAIVKVRVVNQLRCLRYTPSDRISP